MAGLIRCECCAKDMDIHVETVVVITVKVYSPEPRERPSAGYENCYGLEREQEADKIKESKRITVCTRCYAKRRPMLWGELWAIAEM